MVKKPKVLLIMFAPYRTVQMQIAALSAFLKSKGCEVRYMEIIIFSGDTPVKFNSAILNEIDNFMPNLVGFSSYDMNHSFILNAADFIKKHRSNIKIVVGGHHASLAPDDYMQNKSIDYVCIGEGEEVLSGLIDNLILGSNIEKIPGLAFRDRYGQVVIPGERSLIENLDSLPFVDRQVLHEQQLELDYLPMLIGKGCYFSCTYCANSKMKNLYLNKNKYVRWRSPEKVIEEIQECKKSYDFKSVYFFDDIFASDFEWLSRFSSMYVKKFGKLAFHCLLRPEFAANEKILSLLSESGCRSISMGVESGSENYRKNFLDRRMSNRIILKAANAIKRKGMDLCIYMMVGLPDETLLDMLKTLWLNFRIGPKGVQTGIYFPIKNTPLYQYCINKKLINEDKRRQIYVYTYDTCLKCSPVKRSIIILFKWLNSAIPVIRCCQFGLIVQYVRIQYKKIFKKTIDYK